jgi:hypothetical protein
MSWQLGAMLICGLLVVIWLAAESHSRETAKREELKRLRKLEVGRVAQAAELIQRATWHGPAR